jgi:hypothetical protein
MEDIMDAQYATVIGFFFIHEIPSLGSKNTPRAHSRVLGMPEL